MSTDNKGCKIEVDPEETDNSSQSRGWTWTLNNYTDQELEDLAEFQCCYVIFGKEVAPTTGTPHLQGYFYFPKKATFKLVRSMLPRASFRKSKGSPADNIRYCSKDGDVYEYGERPCQGKRKDLDILKEKILKKEQITMREVSLTCTSYQGVRMAETLLKYHEPKRNWKPYVKWIHGPTGTGKTRLAMEELGEDCYVAMETNKWWDGYDAHEHVLIDDMRKDFCKFHVLLRLLDRYAFTVEYKGGSRQFLAKKIYITSCHSPEDMFETREDIKQLMRRIDEVVYLATPRV